VGTGFLQAARNVITAAGINIPLDFSDILKPYLSIPFPGLSGASYQTINSSTVDIRLEYGEYQFNVETQARTTVSTSQSSTVKVIDGSRQFFDDTINPSNDHVVLSRRPAQKSIGLNQHDWLYVLVSTGQVCIVTVSIYDAAGGLLGTHGQAMFQGQIGYVPIGGANMITQAASAAGPKEDWAYAIVSLTNLVNWSRTEFRVDFDRSECNEQPAEILFQEPIGGFTSIGFDSVDFAVQRQASIAVSKYQHSASLSDNIAEGSGGRSVASLRGPEVLTFRRAFDARTAREMRGLIRSLAASKRHFVKYELPNGNIEAIPAILESSNISSYTDGEDFELEVQLTIFKDLISA
jgi:hypothetical protein